MLPFLVTAFAASYFGPPGGGQQSGNVAVIIFRHSRYRKIKTRLDAQLVRAMLRGQVCGNDFRC